MGLVKKLLLLIFIINFTSCGWDASLKEKGINLDSNSHSTNEVSSTNNQSTSSSWNLTGTGFSNISDDYSTLTPVFDLESLPAGTTAILLKNADSNCANGEVMGAAVTSPGNLTPQMNALNLGSENDNATYRLKIIDNLNNSQCLDSITYNYPELAAIQDFSMGHFTSCLVLTSGQIKCIGVNNYGQLGDGTNTYPNEPVLVSGITNATKVSTFYNHTCALLSTGSIQCWGSDSVGALGDNIGTSNSNVPVDVSSITNATDLVVSSYNSCAILSDQTVQCWGDGSNGKNGDGASTPNFTPNQVTGLTGVIALDLGINHACAVTNSGSVECWGTGTSGALGNNSGANSSTPVTVSGITTAIDVSVGTSFACALLSDQTVQCWGNNQQGQLGDGSTTNSLVPVTVTGLSNVVQISSGYAFTCALTSGDEIKCWGRNNEGQISNTAPDTNTNVVNSYTSITNINSIYMGGLTSCALLNSGEIKCWGQNEYKQRGFPHPNELTLPTLGTSFIDFNSISSSSPAFHTCFEEKGTNDLKCFGANWIGQLGNSSYQNSSSFVQANGFSNVDDYSVGGSHSCVIVNGGEIKCWGENGLGQLGNNSTTDSFTPVDVVGITNATKIAAGGDHTCALLSDQTVVCWGDNYYGRLGDGTTNNSLVPVAVSGVTDAINLYVGNYHGCIIRATGAVNCWGYNWEGQLGDGNSTYSTTPVVMTGVTNPQKISMGEYHTCLILADNSVKCVGANWSNQLGDGTSTSSLSLVSTSGITNAVDISSGSIHTCVLTSDDDVKCWGDGYQYQIGDGTDDPHSTPYTVSLDFTPTHITTTYETSCAYSSTKGIYSCWGSNYEYNGGVGVKNINLYQY